MLTHSHYEEDPRVRREAEALAAAGHRVVVYALRLPGDAAGETLDGVEVRRLGVQRHQGAGLGTYLREYLSFFVRAGAALARAQRRDRFGVVHVHTLPDFLVFASAPVRLTGIPVILDLHEAMPEFFETRFRGGRSGAIGRRALSLQERAAIRFASAVITVNDALGERLRRLGVPADKLTILPNVPSLARFDPGVYPPRAFMADGALRLVYAGGLSPTYELDVALQALAALRTRRPDLDIRLDLYGRDFAEVPLRDQAAALGLGDRVTFHGRVPIAAVPAAIAAADAGLAPTRHTEMTDYSLSTKVFEYAAMGRPVVASRLPMVERTFGDDVVTYAPGNSDAMAAAIEGLVDDPGAREARTARAQERVRSMAWEVESRRLIDLVARLTDR